MVASIASGYTDYAQVQVQREAQTAVLAEAVEEVERQGEALVGMINDSSVNGRQDVFSDPMLGQNVDMLV